MKICPKCNAKLEDSVQFCVSCGVDVSNVTPVQPQPEPQPQPQPQPQYQYQYQQPVDPFDHTAEFSQQEIDEGKIFAMLPYLLSLTGVIIALIAGQNNKFIMFHVRQAMKFTVVTTLLIIIAAILCITIIVPIVAGICVIIVFVLEIIAFFQVCNGKAKEPAIIRNMNFLGH